MLLFIKPETLVEYILSYMSSSFKGCSEEGKMGVKLSLVYLLSSHIHIYSWDKPSCQVCREGENFLCEWRRVLHGERPFKSLKILVQVRKEILCVTSVHDRFFQMIPCLMMYCCCLFQFRCIL